MSTNLSSLEHKSKKKYKNKNKKAKDKNIIKGII